MISDIEVINMLVGIYLTYMGVKDLRYGKVENEITIVFIALCIFKFYLFIFHVFYQFITCFDKFLHIEVSPLLIFMKKYRENKHRCLESFN